MQQQSRDGLWEMAVSRWAGQQERWRNPKSSLCGSWLLPTEQGMDLCCPHGVVKCPTTPLTPPCRWATLVLLNKAASGAVGFCLARFFFFFVFLFLLWHAREIYRNNIKRPESGEDGCAELTTGPRICQAGIYYSRGGDSYVKIKLKSQQWNCIKAGHFQAASQ